MSKSSKSTKKTIRLSAALTDLFVKVESDQNNLEDLMAKGSAAVAAFNGSTEALLRGILNPPENWQFPADSKPYEAVKKAVADRAADKGEKVTLPEGSIAGGKWRAVARESDEPLTRLAGMLAGRLSTLMSKGKDGSSAKTKNKGDKGDKGKKADKGDLVGKAWDEGYRAGMADMGVTILTAISAKKSLKEIAEAIMENTTVEEREAAAARIKEALAAKKAA